MKKRLKQSFIFLLLLGIVSVIAVYSYFSFTQEAQVMNEAARKSAPGKFVKLSKGVTHYQLEGPDTGRVVVLVHGGGAPGLYVWERNYYALAKAGFRVLRFDLYGRGYSDRPSVDYTRAFLTDQLSELMDSLKLKEPFDLIGSSLGCNIAINFTYSHPDRVKKLILFNPAAINPGSPHWYFKNKILADFLLTVYWAPRSIDRQMHDFYNADSNRDYEKSLVYFHQFKGVKDVFLSTSKNLLTEDCKEEVAAIGKQDRKVLLFWGRQDPITLFDSHKKYTNLISELELVPLNKAGHLSNFERADTVNPVLISYLRK